MQTHATRIMDYKTRVGSRTEILAWILQIAYKTSKIPAKHKWQQSQQQEQDVLKQQQQKPTKEQQQGKGALHLLGFVIFKAIMPQVNNSDSSSNGNNKI